MLTSVRDIMDEVPDKCQFELAPSISESVHNLVTVVGVYPTIPFPVSDETEVSQVPELLLGVEVILFVWMILRHLLGLDLRIVITIRVLIVA